MPQLWRPLCVEGLEDELFEFLLAHEARFRATFGAGATTEG
jgi:hypothetical protein